MKNYVEETIKKTINSHELIASGDHVVLGLSGGPDSMCLFYALLNLKDSLGFTMEAVHINHKLRPVEAEKDQEYVEGVCLKYGIKCTSFVYDCIEIAKKEGLTHEEAGRIVRYRSFDEVASGRRGQIKIAVAHNMDDQCETMLFRLMRGTGPDGLCGIMYSRKSEAGFVIIRPLLDVDRKSIEEYCRINCLNPRIDHTNSETEFTRNRIRNELIPYIEENFNIEFKKALLRLSDNLTEDRYYFEEEIKRILNEISDEEGNIKLDKFNGMPRNIRHRLIKVFLAGHGVFEDVSRIHIESIDEMCSKSETSKKINLPGGEFAEVSYGKLVMQRSVNMSDTEECMTAVFSKEALLKEFGTYEYEIRKRKPGDYIYIAAGRKKVKDLLIDMKIPRQKRDEIVLIAIGSEVLWIPGIRYSSRYRAKKDDLDSMTVEIFVNI